MWGITLRDRIPTLCLWSLDLRMGRLLDSCNSPSWLGLCARNRLHDTVNPFGTQQAQRTTRVGPFEGEELAVAHVELATSRQERIANLVEDQDDSQCRSP